MKMATWKASVGVTITLNANFTNMRTLIHFCPCLQVVLNETANGSASSLYLPANANVKLLTKMQMCVT